MNEEEIKKVWELFLEERNLSYSSSLNPWEMFKAGFIAGTKQKLNIHSVMQAEWSASAEGAAVASGAAGQGGHAVKVKTGTVIFCEGEQFIFGINRKTGKVECFNLYGMSGISDEEALPR